MGAARLRPWQLFLGVKLTEALFHLRPRALYRLLFEPDARLRKLLRAYLPIGTRNVAAEILEFLFKTRFVRAGSLGRVAALPNRLPGKTCRANLEVEGRLRSPYHRTTQADGLQLRLEARAVHAR